MQQFNMFLHNYKTIACNITKIFLWNISTKHLKIYTISFHYFRGNWTQNSNNDKNA